MKKVLIFLSLSLLVISCATAQLPAGKGWKNVTLSKGNFPDTINIAKAAMIQKVPLVASATDLNKLAGISTTNTELGYIHGLSGPIATLLSAKQATLVSGSTIKTLNGNTLLGSGDLVISGAGTVTSVAGTSANGVSFSISNPTSAANMTITLGDITPSHVNGVGISSGGSAALTVTGTSSVSGTNTGDNAVNSLYSGLVSNANHSGDATGSTSLRVVGLNNVLLSSLSTGILKNTTTTGAPSIAVAGVDYLTPSGSAASLTSFPTLNQSTSGNAATATALQNARTINTVSFNGTANISVPSNIAPGTSGNLMKSNGSVWTSAAPPDTISLNNVVALKHPSTRSLTTSGTLQLTDDGNYIQMNSSSATTLTIPLHSSVGFVAGTGITFYNIGSGTCTITLTGGVSADYPALGVPQHGWVFLFNPAGNDTWAITGKLQ
jgi:hypothetical protein